MDALKVRAERIINLMELTKTQACVVKSLENRRYFTDLSTSEGMVVITAKGNRYVIVDDRYEEICEKQLAPQGFIIKIVVNGNYRDIMYEIVQSDRVSVMLLESEDISHEEYTHFENSMYCKISPLKSQLAKIRASKDIEEVESLKTAQRISEKTFEEIINCIKPGMTEKQVQARLVQSLLENGSDLDKFHIWCVSGANSSLVHGVATDKVIEKGDALLLDFGAVYNGYRSCLARTISIGRPNGDFAEAYKAVKNAGLLGAKHIRAGVSAKEVDDEIRGYIEQMGYGKYFVHDSGHGLGLSYTEAPVISSRSRDVLEKGNIIITEPGIYIKGKFGIRIGDTFYIGERGTEDLTKIQRELIIL